jgi:CTP:molybdopterin cytidylyltransferase MocA
VRYIEVNDENVVRNVNTPEEYAQASQALMGGTA